MLELTRTKGLSIKGLDERTREDLRRFMLHLHHEKGLSLSDIAKLIGNKTSGYTSWLCRQLGVPARPFEEARLKGIREKRRKYERTPFDGNDEDKAYLLGLRHGDLSVSTPWRGAIRVSTSTTHPAMAELFRNLFEPYGYVYQHPRFKEEMQSYEWNLEVILDDSFQFLLSSHETSWEWVARKESTMCSYLAGIWDAEGSVGIYPNSRVTSIRLSVYNTDTQLLQFIRRALINLGYTPMGPYLEKLKGSKTSKHKIPHRKDYWRLAIFDFDQAQSLLRRLPLLHREKVAKEELALSLRRGEHWDRVAARIEAIRNSIQLERDRFLVAAQLDYERRRIEKKRICSVDKIKAV